MNPIFAKASISFNAPFEFEHIWFCQKFQSISIQQNSRTNSDIVVNNRNKW